MFKKRFLNIFLLLTSIGLFFNYVGASSYVDENSPQLINTPETTSNHPVISVFVRDKCPHCQDEEEFLTELQEKRPDLQVRLLEIHDSKSRELFNLFTEQTKTPKVTPITIIGQKSIIGFDKAETTGQQIIKMLETENATLTLENFLGLEPLQIDSTNTTCAITETPDENSPTDCSQAAEEHRYISVPFFGQINVSDYTLPTLSIILGFIDGFNPCAMWVLIVFLTALTHAGSVKKMVQFASVFIVAEAIMYTLILNSWGLAFDFIGFDEIVTPIIGLVAIGGGIFFLWEAKQSDGTCKVTNIKQRTTIIQKVKNLASQKFSLVVFLGLIALAFSVNIIEFACSIGIPQAFIKILDINQLSWLMKEYYIGLYILFYMVDDLIVFGVAIYSFEKLGLTSKYTKYSNFIGGILMLILGLLLLVAPEKLAF